MAILTVTALQLAAEMRKFPKRTEKAILRATYRTAEVDAQRAIQIAIHTGETVTLPVSRPSVSRGEKVAKKQPVASKTVSKGLPQTGTKREPKVPDAGGPPAKQKPRRSSKGARGGYRPPIDTGDYKGTWKSERLPDGALIYSGASPRIKAGVIEKGRRPAPIPIRPLAQWVMRKLGIKEPKEARSVAFAISKVASERKRPGLKVLGRARPAILKALKINLERELQKAIARGDNG